MSSWTTSQTLGALTLGVLFVLGGIWIVVDPTSQVRRFALWDCQRWMRQRVKTGIYPSSLVYRMLGGAVMSPGVVLLASVLDHVTGHIAHGLLVVIEAFGVIGCAAILVASAIVSSVTRKWDRRT